MGRTANWFAAVKKALNPESAEKKQQRIGKRKKKWGFRKSRQLDPYPSSVETVAAPPISHEASKLTEAENEQNKHAYSVALATAAAAEAAVAAAQAAAEVVRLTSATPYLDKSREEIAATKIQTAFRGYLARKALRALRGLIRLKKLMDGNSVRHQTATALHCMQTLARAQSQILSRRVKMAEENMALRRQLQLKQERELENLKLEEDWDDRLQSKEQLEANIQHKQEAAIRRERALAYAFSHQRKNINQSMYPLFTDISNPHWGWSWLERWMGARPCESRSAIADLSDPLCSIKGLSRCSGESIKTSASHSLNGDKGLLRPLMPSHTENCQSPSTPQSKGAAVGKSRLVSPHGRRGPADDDTRSTTSLRSEKCRRHSIAGSVVRDDESLTSSSSLPSYMASTESVRAKSRLSSPSRNKMQAMDQGSALSVKKRLSFPPSPIGARRQSTMQKMEVNSVKDIGASAVKDRGVYAVSGENR